MDILHTVIIGVIIEIVGYLALEIIKWISSNIEKEHNRKIDERILKYIQNHNDSSVQNTKAKK